MLLKLQSVAVPEFKMTKYINCVAFCGNRKGGSINGEEGNKSLGITGERVIDRAVEGEIISVWKRELGQKHGLAGFLITTRIVADETTCFIAR